MRLGWPQPPPSPGGHDHKNQSREDLQSEAKAARGDCQDGLWGQVAVWPPNLVRVAWEPAAPVHCPPWWPRAPTACYGDARRRGQSLDGVLQRLAGLPAGVVPAGHKPGEGRCTHPHEGLR